MGSSLTCAVGVYFLEIFTDCLMGKISICARSGKRVYVPQRSHSPRSGVCRIDGMAMSVFPLYRPIHFSHVIPTGCSIIIILPNQHLIHMNIQVGILWVMNSTFKKHQCDMTYETTYKPEMFLINNYTREVSAE